MKDGGFTQERLAAQLGISHSAVSRWLSGSIPRPARLKILSEILGVSVSFLESGYGSKQPATQPEAQKMGDLIHETQDHTSVVREEYCPPKRDETLALARARTERYSEQAGEALEETLTDLRDLLEILAGSGPKLSPAMVAAAKERIDHFAQELIRQRDQDLSVT